MSRLDELEKWAEEAKNSMFVDKDIFLKMIEVMRRQNEALRTCGSGGNKLSHHHAQWFNEEEVEAALAAFQQFEEGK